MHKSGFVNIIGNPNVGKSTLMNALLEEKLSIVTPKAQTTRQRVLGFLNEENYQIIFSDTPGFISKPAYSLHEKMLEYINDAFLDADILILMLECGNIAVHEDLLTKIQDFSNPLIVILNKIDVSNQVAVDDDIKTISEKFPNAKIIPASAMHGFNVDFVKNTIIELLPEHEPYYPKDVISDRYLRFFVSEIIREQIFLQFQQEIPYHTEVIINYFKENEEIPRIGATIFVSRESQKIILVGKGGAAIKKLGTEARKNIEKFIGQHIYLDLNVKVNENWRNDLKKLKNLGY